jgi:hypothetical protein
MRAFYLLAGILSGFAEGQKYVLNQVGSAIADPT